MNKLGLLVRVVAKPEHAAEVAAFLSKGAAMAEAEQGTPLWCAVQLDNNNFVIFDSHVDEAGRQAHLNGPIAAKLMEAAGAGWFTQPPSIENTTFLSSKVAAAAVAR